MLHYLWWVVWKNIWPSFNGHLVAHVSSNSANLLVCRSNLFVLPYWFADSCNKLAFILHFLKCWPKEFVHPYFTKRPSVVLIRHIIECGVIIWTPNYNVWCTHLIKSGRKSFLRFALCGLGWVSQRMFSAYDSHLKLIVRPTLLKFPPKIGVFFISKLLHGEVKSPVCLINWT